MVKIPVDEIKTKQPTEKELEALRIWYDELRHSPSHIKVKWKEIVPREDFNYFGESI